MDYKTERNKRIVERSYYPVEKVDVGMGKYAIINRETGSKLSDVSKRYTLVKNEEIFKPFVERFGYENIKSFFSYGRGKYTHMKINTGRRFNFGTDETPDWIDEQIIVENSYNKTRSFRFMFGAFRYVCTNGLYSGNAEINYRKIHVGEIPVQEIIARVFDNYESNSFETWKKLREKPLTLETAIKMIETFEAFELKEEKVNDYDINHRIRNRARGFLGKEENADNQRNGWGLYNQLNRAIAYEVRGNSKVSQRISANKKTERFLTEKVLTPTKESFGLYLN